MNKAWMKRMASTMVLLAVTASSAAANETPLHIPTGVSDTDGQPKVVDATPVRGEIVATEGILKWNPVSGGYYEVDGWMVVGDHALFERLKGQEVWVLGTEAVGPSIQIVRRVNVERIEKPLP